MLWPIVPSHLPGEALSSWLYRLAEQNRISVRAVLDSIGVQETVETIDIDIESRLEIFRSIVKFTGLTKYALREMTLVMPAVSTRPAPLNHLHWSTTGRPYARQASGLSFCPHCLGEDYTPYFRLAWRMSYITACSRHGTVLLDRCSVCQTPVSHYRSAIMRNLPIKYCSGCGSDLSLSPTVKTFPGVIPWQTTLLQFLKEIRAKTIIFSYVNRFRFYPTDLLYFEHTLMLMLNCDVKFWMSDYSLIKSSLIDEINNYRENKRSFHTHSTIFRHWLMHITLNYMTDWPYRLLQNTTEYFDEGLSGESINTFCNNIKKLLKSVNWPGFCSLFEAIYGCVPSNQVETFTLRGFVEGLYVFSHVQWSHGTDDAVSETVDWTVNFEEVYEFLLNSYGSYKIYQPRENVWILVLNGLVRCIITRVSYVNSWLKTGSQPQLFIRSERFRRQNDGTESFRTRYIKTSGFSPAEWYTFKSERCYEI